MRLASPGPVVLLQEDDLRLRALLTRELEAEGCRVEAVAGAEPLAERVRQSFCHAASVERPALLVTNVKFRGGSGLTLGDVQRLTSYDVPVLLLSAFPPPELERQVELLERCQLLAKPFDLFAFAAVARSLVGTGQRTPEPPPGVVRAISPFPLR
jgi:DNA-binding response OmpR family regulator